MSGVVAAELRSVRLMPPKHTIPKAFECEIYEDGQCGELRWERVYGLLAGELTGLQVAPSDPSVIYAAVDANDMSIFKSEDGGGNWKRIHYQEHPKGIAVHPTNADILIYTDGAALYRTTDGGHEWSNWTTVLTRLEGGITLQAIAFSSDEPNIAYAVASPGQLFGVPGAMGQAHPWDATIYRSADAGATWEEVSRDYMGSVADLAVMAGDPDILFAATSNGVYRSADGGRTWGVRLYDGPATDILSIDIALDRPESFLAASGERGVYRSTNGGLSWTTSNAGLDNLQTHKVVFAPSDPNVAYVTTHDGVYRSDDAGESWSRRSTGLAYTFVDAITVDPRDADVAHVSTASERFNYHRRHFKDGLNEGEGQYTTTDGGLTWIRRGAGLEEAGLVQMFTPPSVPFNVWVMGQEGRGMFFSPDAGETWLFSPTVASHYGMVIGFSTSFPTELNMSSWAGLQEQLIKSTDGGHTWIPLKNSLLAGVSERSRTLGLFDENAAGQILPVHGIAVAPSDPNIIYAGTLHDTSLHAHNFSLTGAHIFRSSDRGTTWLEMDEGFPIETHTSINAIAVHPSDPNVAYVVTSRYESETAIGIYKTTNGGETWVAANDGLSDLNTNDLQMDPAAPDTLYVATDSGVYKTMDAARTWRLAATDWTAGSVYDLAIDTRNPLVLYAATTGGAYKTKDCGEHWYAVNLGLPKRSDGGPAFGHDRILELDSTGRVVYAVILTEPKATDPREPDPTAYHGHPERLFQERLLYRAVVEPLQPVTYEFVLEDGAPGEGILVESTSNVYGMTFDWDTRELNFTVAGPTGTVSQISVTAPILLQGTPFTVTMNGQIVPSSSQGGAVTFQYEHGSRSEVKIRGGS